METVFARGHKFFSIRPPRFILVCIYMYLLTGWERDGGSYSHPFLLPKTTQLRFDDFYAYAMINSLFIYSFFFFSRSPFDFYDDYVRDGQRVSAGGCFCTNLSNYQFSIIGRLHIMDAMWGGKVKTKRGPRTTECMGRYEYKRRSHKSFCPVHHCVRAFWRWLLLATMTSGHSITQEVPPCRAELP